MTNFLLTFADYGSDLSDQFAEQFGAAYSATSLIFSLIIYVISAVALMKMFAKAGVTSWYAWVPFLNAYWLMKIATGNGWLFLLALIPCVGSLIVLILLAVKLAPAFGYGGGMIALLIFFPFIAYLVIGFGSSQYVGPQ